MNTSIIITFLNNWKMTHARLMEIYKFLPDVYEIVLADDGSTDQDVWDGIEWWESKGLLPLRFIGSDQPTSFAANVNRGVSVSTGDLVIVTQNDVMISGDFRDVIRSKINEHSVVGKLLDWDTGWNTFDGITVPYIEGWLICCLRKVWDDIGGLDENIVPYDAEDIDFSIRAKQKGYDLVNVDVPFLRHIGGQTIKYSPERRKVTENNIQYVKNKWKEKLEKIYE